MNLLHKLPGYRRSPYGLECRILRRMPLTLLASVLVPGLLALAARGVVFLAGWQDAERLIQRVDFAMIGLASLTVYLAATLSLGCVIVWLMKGPAYVADAYDLPHSNAPRP